MSTFILWPINKMGITRKEAIDTIYDVVFLLSLREDEFKSYADRNRNKVQDWMSLDHYSRILRECMERKEEIIKEVEEWII